MPRFKEFMSVGDWPLVTPEATRPDVVLAEKPPAKAAPANADEPEGDDKEKAVASERKGKR